MLFLIKSSRFREYQQENLRLLQARAGTSVQIRYNRIWLQPGLDAQRLVHSSVALVLCDKPYRSPAPVRLGRVTGVRDELERVEISVVLGGYPPVDLDLGEFQRWFAERGTDSERPILVFEDEGFQVAEESATQPRLACWKASVERIFQSDAAPLFESSLFLLDLGIRDEHAGGPVEPVDLITGRSYSQRLYCYSPHLTADELERRSLGLAYDRTEIELLERLAGPEADGQLELRFRVLVPGSARLNVFVRPEAERSSRLDLDYHAAGDVIGRVAACEEAAGEQVREGLRGLLALLQKHGSLAEPELERNVLDRLLALAPEDQELNRALAHHHHRVGDDAAARQLFGQLGAAGLAPEDWLPYFLSACRCNCAGDALVEIVSNLPWDRLSPEQAGQVGRCLAKLPERVILDLLEALAYFGTERFLEDIWQELRPAIRSADGILQAYRILHETHLDSPAAAFHYLQDRAAQEEIASPEFDTLLVENGVQLDSAPSGFTVILLRHMRRLVDAARQDDALVIMELARPGLSAAAYEGVRLDLADSLTEAGSQAGVRLAGRLFADAAESSRVRGDLDEAAMWLERSALADPDGERLVEVQATVERAIEASEHVQLLSEALFAQRIKALRDKLAGTRLTIVGGPHEKPWVGELRKELAVSEVNWFISDMGKPPRAEKVREALGKATGAVAIITFHVGHRAAEVVREEARKRDIPCAPVFSGTSKNALLQALIKAVLD